MSSNVARSWEDQLAFGQEGEHIVARELIRRGYAVHPLYQYDGHDKAPVILWEIGGDIAVGVLPDLQLFKGGGVKFAEVKRKNRWTRNPSGGPHETGLNQRLLNEYLAVEVQTGCPVILFFIHETRQPTGIFYISLTSFRQHCPFWDGKHHQTGKRIEEPLALCECQHLNFWMDVPGSPQLHLLDAE